MYLRSLLYARIPKQKKKKRYLYHSQLNIVIFYYVHYDSL